MKPKTILILSLVVYMVFGLALYVTQEKIDTINYCEIYADQKVTSSRIGISGGERQYNLNGTWVNESILKEDCLK